MRSRTLRFAGHVLLTGCLLAGGAAHAQVGTVDPLPYPGWIPSDRVAPAIGVSVGYDDAAGVWRYHYTLANGAEAEQDVFAFILRVSGAPQAASAAPGWWQMIGPAELYSPGAPGAVVFEAELPGTLPDSDYWPPSEFQIPPGGSLAGYTVTSAYPPGYARAYVQGYARLLLAPSEYSEDPAYNNPIPPDSLNSQRRWSIGPTRYQGVMTRGNLNLDNAEGFLGFMNVALTETVLRNPAPVALKLSLGGETVFPETFKAVLNGVDVTAHFHPGPSDGADLVGLFSLDTLPLQEGTNVLATTIEGLLPGTTRRAIDEDLIRFDVQRQESDQ